MGYALAILNQPLIFTFVLFSSCFLFLHSFSLVLLPLSFLLGSFASCVSHLYPDCYSYAHSYFFLLFYFLISHLILVNSHCHSLTRYVSTHLRSPRTLSRERRMGVKDMPYPHNEERKRRCEQFADTARMQDEDASRMHPSYDRHSFCALWMRLCLSRGCIFGVDGRREMPPCEATKDGERPKRPKGFLCRTRLKLPLF